MQEYYSEGVETEFIFTEYTCKNNFDKQNMILEREIEEQRLEKRKTFLKNLKDDKENFFLGQQNSMKAQIVLKKLIVDKDAIISEQKLQIKSLIQSQNDHRSTFKKQKK